MSMSVSRAFRRPDRAKLSAVAPGVDTGCDVGRGGQTKGPAQRPGPSITTAASGSDSRHHVLEAEQVGQRLELAPLIIAEAHHQREAGRLEPFDVNLADIDRGEPRALALAVLPVFHLAQLGLDRRPIAFLLRREVEPPLDAGDLRIV